MTHWTWPVALTVVATACGGATAHVKTEGAGGGTATAEAAREFREIEPAALWKKMQSAEQVFVVDNNRPETYALAHVPGAVAMRPADVTADKLPEDKGAMLVFYCANEH
ncbi:MAG: rhodanese-like domain-containing protein [Deltaproteobacteria bacterium]|nr:rhodanese-like domain-containing protein [Deltaproteobacteria bacterium]